MSYYFLRLWRMSCVARAGCNDEFSRNERIRQSNGPSKYRCSYCQGTQKHFLSRSLSLYLSLSLSRSLSFSLYLSLPFSFPSYVSCLVPYVYVPHVPVTVPVPQVPYILCLMSNAFFFFSLFLFLPPSLRPVCLLNRNFRTRLCTHAKLLCSLRSRRCVGSLNSIKALLRLS
jgi:hypothetical protein